jgi:hypothetical protein
MPDDEPRPARLTAQLLAGRAARTPEDVVHRLLAVQAQDPRGFRLAVRARSAGLVAADVNRALTESRSLVVTWLQRGTLHLVTADDYWWLQPLMAPRIVTANERRLRQEGVSARQADRGVEVITDALDSGEARTRDELRALLDDAGVPTAGQALVHLIVAASLRSDVVRGPVVGNHHAFVSARRWLGPPTSSVARDEALARLARRYLAGHAPATADDLAKWTGLPLRDARAGFDAIAGEVTQRDDGLVAPKGARTRARAPGAKLLGAFDPLLHGWVSREPFVGPYRHVVTSNGIFRPVVLVDGRVIATWGLADGQVSITTLEPVPAHARDTLRREAADVLRFLALPPRPLVVS